MNEPIDQLHVECIEAQFEIRASFHQLRRRAAQWEPLPCPRREPRYARSDQQKGT